MANVKISALPAATQANSTDEFPANQSGTTRKITTTQILANDANKPAVTVVATSNQTLSGTPTIDGQATAAGSIILLTAQSSGSENGPWVAAAGAWSRPSWYSAGSTSQAFQFITTFVRLGTTYQGSTWRMTTSGTITIDTTATTWVVTPHAMNANTVIGTVFNASTITSNTSAVANKTYFCDTSGGAFNVTLPTPTLNNYVTVKDSTGSFSTNNLTVVRNGAEKIEGLAASKVLQSDWGSVTFLSNGTDWFMV